MFTHVLDQIVAGDDALYRHSGRAGGGVAGEGVACHRSAMHKLDRLGDAARIDRGAERQIAAGEAFGDRHDIGEGAVMLQCPPGAAAPGAAHHFIGDHNHAIPVADLADQPCIAGRSRHHAAGGSDHRLEDESRDGLRPQFENLVFELPGAMR